MLSIENLKAKIDEKEILKGLNLDIKPGEVHAIMGPNGSGKSTLSNILSGKKGYEINGKVTFDGENLLELETEERAHKGIFLAFQYPMEIPGVNTNTFLKTSINAIKKARGEKELDAIEFLKLIKEKSAELKFDEKIAPNTYNKMEFDLIDKLVLDLIDINYEGAFCLCGYGEPMLHKDYLKIVNKLAAVGPVEIITNGDAVNKSSLLKIYQSNASRLLISLYDGPEQLEKFPKMIEETGVPKEFVILRDRWYSDKIDFGVKLTNRTGTIEIGNQPEVNIKQECYYTAYQVLIDWNGDVFLCPQDWQRRNAMGNIMQKKFFDIWNGKILSKYRNKLLNGDRSLSPCNSCNADGTVYGTNHYLAWKKLI